MKNNREEVKTQQKTEEEMKAIITVNGKIFPFPLTMEQLENCRKSLKSKKLYKEQFQIQ